MESEGPQHPEPLASGVGTVVQRAATHLPDVGTGIDRHAYPSMVYLWLPDDTIRIAYCHGVTVLARWAIRHRRSSGTHGVIGVGLRRVGGSVRRSIPLPAWLEEGYTMLRMVAALYRLDHGTEIERWT